MQNTDLGRLLPKGWCFSSLHLLSFTLRAICFADPEEEGGEFRFSPPYLLWELHTLPLNDQGVALDRQEEEPEEKMLKKSNCDFFLTHFLPRLVLVCPLARAVIGQKWG